MPDTTPTTAEAAAPVSPAALASSDAGASTSSDAPASVLRVVKGDPTPEELAALVAVVAARASAAPAPADPERASDWATYWRHAKRPLHPGPNRWRASAHP